MKLNTLLIYLIPFFGFASPQIPELLIYKNDTIPIYNLIIEDYLERNNTNLLGENQGQLFGLNFRGGSFNCWRGYQGVYKIENDSLFIVEMIPIEGFIPINENGELLNPPKPKSYLEIVFKNKIKNNRVFANWYAEDIVLRNGELLRWDGVFVRNFEKEKILSIKNGKINKIFDVQNYVDLPEGITRRFNDKISDSIFEELKNIKWNNDLDYDCSEKYEFIIGKNGKIKNIQMAHYKSKEEIDKFWDKKEHNYCTKALKNKVKKIQFDLVRNKGKNIEETVLLEIWDQ